jgi:hypothetical protein
LSGQIPAFCSKTSRTRPDVLLPETSGLVRRLLRKPQHRENRKKLPMNCPTPFAAATPPVPNLISRSPLRRGFPVVLLVLGLFALSSTARAVSPPPDGGYPGNNTAEGDGALSSVQINATTGFGIDNTAIGFDALFSNTTGSFNTASGSQALFWQYERA